MSAPTPIYIVSVGGEVDQVFATREDADSFASDIPDARITRRHLRRSVDEALVIFERRVVVAQGATVIDRTNVVRQFVDDPLDTPEGADVEWFRDSTDAVWHIAGFGIDRAALDATMQNVIDRVRRLEAAS